MISIKIARRQAIIIMSTVRTGTDGVLSGPPVPPLFVGRLGIHEAPA